MPSRHGIQNIQIGRLSPYFFYLLWYGFNFNHAIALIPHILSLRNKPFHILFGQFMLWIQ